MPKLVVVTREGCELAFEVGTGLSVMEIIRDNGVDGLQALCGGSSSCGTCHVYVDPAFSGRLPNMSDDENDLLDVSDYRDERSRLSCQIALTDELDGLIVTITPDD